MNSPRALIIIGAIFFFYSNVSAKPPNYGKIWHDWSEHEQKVFVIGFQYGLMASIAVFADNYDITGADSAKFMAFTKKISQKPDFKAIQKAINYLYSDSSNTYISLGNIGLIAEKKLKGENIEKELELNRKQAGITNDVMKKIESDSK